MYVCILHTVVCVYIYILLPLAYYEGVLHAARHYGLTARKTSVFGDVDRGENRCHTLHVIIVEIACYIMNACTDMYVTLTEVVQRLHTETLIYTARNSHYTR